MTEKKERQTHWIMYGFVTALFFAMAVKDGGWAGWVQHLLVSAAAALLAGVVCGDFLPRPALRQDVPPHDHGYRLHYAAGMNGWEIVCPCCGKRWKLHEDDAFFIRGGVYALWILFVLLWVFLPFRTPAVLAPYEKLIWMAACVPAALIVHPVAGLLLRGKDLSRHIEQDQEVQPSAGED